MVPGERDGMGATSGREKAERASSGKFDAEVTALIPSDNYKTHSTMLTLTYIVMSDMHLCMSKKSKGNFHPTSSACSFSLPRRMPRFVCLQRCLELALLTFLTPTSVQAKVDRQHPPSAT